MKRPSNNFQKHRYNAQAGKEITTVFCKDNRTENFLTQMGVEFQYSNAVTFDQLAPGWDARNLARPVPVREDAVLEYAALMDGGSPAPATILHPTDNGHDVLDGVQRLSAEKLMGTTTFSAYLVKCDSDNVLAAIRVLANARLQGRAEPPEWTRKRAVEILVNERGLSVEEVARMGGWKPSDVEYTARIIAWGFQIRCIGGPTVSDKLVDCISKHTSQEELTKEPKLIAEFLNTLKVAQFSADDAEPFVENFFSPISKNRHETYRERLDEFLQEPEVDTRVHGRRSAGLSRDISLRRTLKSAVTILDSIVDEGEELRYVDEFFKLTKDINSKLHSLSKKHAKAISVAVPADRYRKETQ